MCRENFRRTGFSLIRCMPSCLQRYQWREIAGIQNRRVFRIDTLLPGLPGWLRRIQPLKSREKHYFVSDFSKKWGHHHQHWVTESLKCSQCEIDGCLCRQPNQYQPNPTIHLHVDFRWCEWWGFKLPSGNAEHIQLPPCVTVWGLERICSLQNKTKPGLGVSM